MSDESLAELGGAAAIEVVASALAQRGAAPGKCRNCGAPLIAAYCAMCGQERDTHRHTIWDLLRDINRVVRTVVAMLVLPGELSLAFHHGRTRRYIPALRLYLFVSLVFFLTLSVSRIALVQIELQELPNAYSVKPLANGGVEIISRGKTSNPIPASAVREVGDQSLSPGEHSGMTTRLHFFGRIGRFQPRLSASGWARIEQIKTNILKAVGNNPDSWMAKNALGTIEKLAHDPAALNGPLTTWIPRVLFLLLPLFGLLLAIFYVRQRKQFYFVEHLEFSLVFHSFIFAILILAIGAAQFLPGGFVAEVTFLAIGIYLLVALKRFYGQGWFMTAIKFVTISFVYGIFFLVPALIFVIATGLVAG